MVSDEKVQFLVQLGDDRKQRLPVALPKAYIIYFLVDWIARLLHSEPEDIRFHTEKGSFIEVCEEASSLQPGDLILASSVLYLTLKSGMRPDFQAEVDRWISLELVWRRAGIVLREGDSLKVNGRDVSSTELPVNLNMKHGDTIELIRPPFLNRSAA